MCDPYNIIYNALQDLYKTGVYLLDFFCSGARFCLLLDPCLCFVSLLYLDLCVLGDDALISYGGFHANQTSMCLDPYLN